MLDQALLEDLAYQALLLPIRLIPAWRAVLSGLMECSITLVSDSIVSTVRGGRGLLLRGRETFKSLAGKAFFKFFLRRRENGVLLSFMLFFML